MRAPMMVVVVVVLVVVVVVVVVVVGVVVVEVGSCPPQEPSSPHCGSLRLSQP